MSSGSRIVIIVGTDHHPFERMVRWADDRRRSHPDDSVMIQHGSSTAPQTAEGYPFLAPDEVRRRMSEADVVITHGGPGTISDARRSGHRPIVCPRDPTQGEHVDDHQQRFAAWCAERGVVDLARTVAELDARLADRPDTRTPPDTAARTEEAVAAFAALVARPTVSRASAAVGADRVLWLLDGLPGVQEAETGVAAGGGVLLGSALELGAEAMRGARCACGRSTGECAVWSPVLDSLAPGSDGVRRGLGGVAGLHGPARRRHLRREDRAAVLAATTPAVELIAAVSRVVGDRLLAVRGPLDGALVLSHDRQVDLAVLDLGLSRGDAWALRRRRVPLVARPPLPGQPGSALPGDHGPDLSPEPGRP